MIIYQSTKLGFMNDIIEGSIEQKIEQLIFEKMNRRTQAGEIRSWVNSLKDMYIVMSNPSIPNEVEVAIEYKIPNSNKRVDFIVTGTDENELNHAVIIELKQWQQIILNSKKDAIVETWLAGGLRETVHPSYQAWSYASMIYDYNVNVRSNDIKINPCAFLHNYDLKDEDPLLDSTYQYYIEKAPVFAKNDKRKLTEFISNFIKKPNNEILNDIEHGVIKPSKSLQDSMASLLRGNQEFVLLDDQKVIYELINDEVRTLKEKEKKVIIIKGGPGTGKSVLAINLLSSILLQEKNVIYVTKNSAPRRVYLEKLIRGNYRRVEINNLFKGPDKFHTVSTDTYDCILVDEAHRLRKKSGMFQNEGEDQIKEIINAARVAVFFIDDLQQVTTSDHGSVEQIKLWSNRLNVPYIEKELISQFRCNGSDGYLAWVDNVLELRHTDWDLIDLDYDVRICESPQEVRDLILKKNQENNKARLLAGYCWNWLKDERNNPYHKDIQIGEFGMPWNFENTGTWAIDPESVNEIGCIHTSQGLEFDYVGVIIGNDLIVEDGQLVTNLFNRARTDQSTRGLKKMYKTEKDKALEIADRIIKNTYRTLLTRGQKGCYIYCVDQELCKHLKSFLDTSV